MMNDHEQRRDIDVLVDELIQGGWEAIDELRTRPGRFDHGLTDDEVTAEITEIIRRQVEETAA